LPLGCFALAIFSRVALYDPEHFPPAYRIVFSLFAIVLIFTTVFVVLHHAETIAHRVGEPYGTLVLTIAVTAIEVSIIVSMMVHDGNNPTLARESVFSTVIIVCAGVVGVCLTLGGLRHRQQDLKRQGTSAFLAVLIALSVISLILPDYTLTDTPGSFSVPQMAFVSLLSLLLYGAFVFMQMARHRDDFVETLEVAEVHPTAALDRSSILPHAALLLIGLLGIVLMTEHVAGTIEDGLEALQVPQSDAIVGAFIATLVLMPEAVSAVKAALKNELQRSLNIALGSACATIGLTIPAVAVASMLTERPLTLGLEAGDTVLLLLALSLSIISFGTGRTNMLTGLVHLVVFVAYLFLIVFP
jgi:Ca2+:H+ antiporter